MLVIHQADRILLTYLYMDFESLQRFVSNLVKNMVFSTTKTMYTLLQERYRRKAKNRTVWNCTTVGRHGETPWKLP